MRLPRIATLVVVAALSLAPGVAAVSHAAAAPARAGATDLRINEIESDGGVPGDWVELVNTGSAAVAAGGLSVRDSDDAHVAVIPAGTSVPPGGYLVVDTPFDLGPSDSARLLAADGSSLDAYTWTSTAPVTYARCADGTGVFTAVATSTRGAANACTAAPVVAAWPGGTTPTTVDPAGVLGGNVSGLAYEATGKPGTLWAVRNSPSVLYELVRTGDQWAPATGDWAAGKTLTFPGGGGAPDAEGVTFTDAGSAAGIFVSSERDGSSNTSRPEILRYDPNVAGGGLEANASWNLTADLPKVGANLGPEAITWVPDSYLTTRGLTDESTGTAYTPSSYPNHGNGLFLAGLEANGNVYAYALDQAGTAFTRVATFSSGFTTVEDLSFDRETQTLWAECDNGCNGRTARLDVTAGAFAVTQVFERPTGMANLNNEGFTFAPQSECVGGTKPVFWADDGNTGGHAVREGTLNCTVLPTCDGLQATVVGTGTIDGTAGDDVIVGSPGPDTIVAGGRDDTVCSLAGADTLDGGADDDALFGDVGADTLTGGDGVDEVRGGAGTDTLVEGATSNGGDILDGGADLDVVDYSARTAGVTVSRDSKANDGATGEKDNVVGAETIDGGQGPDVLTGSDGSDTLIGNGGADRLTGGLGADTLRGGAGADTLVEGAVPNGADVLDGGADLDTLDYSARTAAVAVSRDGKANDGAAGEKDNAVGTETIKGGSGADTLVGSDGADVLLGNGGNDTLTGGLGADELRGGNGADTLVEGAVANGADILDGGADADTVDYSARTAAVKVSRDGVANDGAAGEKDNVVGSETVIGGAGNDTLSGGPGADILRGEGGNDTLSTVDGVSGNDTADGGDGVDTAQTDPGDTVVDVP